MTTPISVLILERWYCASLGHLWETLFWKACGTQGWGAEQKCDSTQRAGFHSRLTLLSFFRPCLRTECSFTLIQCSLNSICFALTTCICICKLGLGCDKGFSKYGWTSELEPYHSHIPTFVKCKKQWEVVFALQYHKNTMLKLASFLLYGKWSESWAFKEKWVTYCEKWITSHILCLGLPIRRSSLRFKYCFYISSVSSDERC